jgi:hypothetical protein
MLTGVAILVHGPRYLPYAWVFVLVVVLAIVLIFIRMYGGGRSSRQAGHQSREAVHRADGESERGESHGHRPRSRRRPHRP